MKRLLCLVLALVVLAGCAGPKQRFSAVNIECFDTITQLIAYNNNESDFKELEVLVFDKLERYHKLFDAYNTYAGINNIKTINDNAGKEPVEVDPELFELLEFSKTVYTLTKGKTNVAMGSVLYLWHEHREKSLSGTETSVPDASKLAEKNQHVNIENLVLDKENMTVFLNDSEMRLDVGAVAKGFAADKIVSFLKNSGYESVAVSLGGNVITIGTRSDGSAWSIGVQDPFDTEGTVLSTKLVDTSLVTSGDYQRFYYHNEKKYHHIIDPATLMPAEYFSSVSVVCPSSATADALSTALFCMPYEEGLKLVEGLEDVEVLWITPDGEQYSTEGFREVVK